MIVEENEEEAYQIIADEFGTEVVRIFEKPKEMKFEKMELDKEWQIADVTYDYQGESVRYSINAVYNDSSIGIGMEDKVIDEYQITNDEGIIVDVKQYETISKKTRYYSAEFSYKGLKYSLIGSIEKIEFENIIKNLFFY